MKTNKVLILLPLGILFFFSTIALRAQEQRFVHLEYIKFKANVGSGYWTQVQDTWKPAYIAMIQEGTLASWKLFWVRFPAGQNIPYDIVNVTFHTDAVAITNSKVANYFIKNSQEEGSDPYLQAKENLLHTINIVKTETYQVVNEANGTFELDSLAKTNQNYQVDFMDTTPEKANAYVHMEAEIFKPMHQVAMADGRLKSWVLCKRANQDDDAMVQRFMIFNQWSSLANWQNGGSFQDFQKVNPGLDQDGFNAIFSKVGRLRQMTKSEMWSIWDEL